MTRRRTGGTWKPSDPRAMYFAAGGIRSQVDADMVAANRYQPAIPGLTAINEIQPEIGEPLDRTTRGFYEFMVGIENGSQVLLDSGAFSIANEHSKQHGISLVEAFGLPPDELEGFDWLFDLYVEIVKEVGDQLWGYIEIDLGGKGYKRIIRQQLHAEGLDPIPVYHTLNDGADYFEELALGFDRIAMGNMVQASRPARLRLLATLFERQQAHPDLWVHILGLTPNDIQFCLPFDSCDSSSWANILRYPQASKWTSMGLKRWAPPDSLRPPMGRPDLRVKATNMAMVELHALQRSASHWHSRLEEAFGPHFPGRTSA